MGRYRPWARGAGLLWWSWVGYAWLTSEVDPDEGPVRLVLFVAMAALPVASLAVPGAFEDLGMLFVAAYAVVRSAHIALFLLASRDDEGLRRSVVGLGISTAVGVGALLVGASSTGTRTRRSGERRWRSTWVTRS